MSQTTEYVVSLSSNELEDAVIVRPPVFDGVAQRVGEALFQPKIEQHTDDCTSYSFPAHPDEAALLAKGERIEAQLAAEGIANVRLETEIHHYQLLA